MIKIKLNLRNVAAIAACLAVFTVLSGCFKEDDPNNSLFGKGSSRENAIPIKVGFSSSYTIQSSGEHWFKFVGTGEPVIFETRGNVVSTYIQVYEETSNWDYGIGSGGEGSNALYEKSTTSGTTYYIRITTQNSTSGTYTFVVTAPFFNIRTNPITVAVGNSSSHVMGSKGSHWFKFIGDGKRVFFETEGNVKNTYITIYFEENTYASYSWDKRGNFITVSGTTYYICITGDSGTYTFNLRHGTGDGSSRYDAKEVVKGYSAVHNISYGGEHWFMYQGTGEPVIFKTTGNVVSTYIQVYEGNSNWDFGTGSGGEGSNALYEKKTTSGTTYTIKVTTQNGTSGEYTFVVE